MIKFRHFLMLNEDKISWLKQNTNHLDTSHDRLAQHQNPHDVIDHFANNADPTKKKIYTQWIVGQYKKQNIRQEDHPRIKETLSNFEKYKSKLDRKDINTYPHINDVDDATEHHVGTAASKKEEKRLTKHEGADLIHDGPNLTIHHLKTHAAAKLYGAGTKWCTASKDRDLFDEYNEHGPLYMAQNKKTNEKHQFHFETGQYMDAEDRDIDLNDFVRENPEMKDVKQFKKTIQVGAHFATGEKELSDHIKNYNNNRGRIAIDENMSRYDHPIEHILNHPDLNSDHIRSLYSGMKSSIKKYKDFKSESRESQESSEISAHRYKNTDEDYHRVQFLHNNSPGLDITGYMHDVVSNKHTPSDVLHQVVKSSGHFNKHGEFNKIGDSWHSDKAVEDALAHKNAEPKTLDMGIKSNNTNLSSIAVKNKNASSKNISDAINRNNHTRVKIAAFQSNSPNLNSEHIKQGLNSSHKDIRLAAAFASTGHNHETRKIMKNHSDHDVRFAHKTME